MKKIENIDINKVILIQNEYIDDKALGRYPNEDGMLYLIDRKEKCAYLIPEKYQKTDTSYTEFCDIGGYSDSGLIMVNTLDNIELQGHDENWFMAGMWGWIDITGEEVIKPKYIYATNFKNGYAIVCKGKWDIDEKKEYWSNNQSWGVIDTKENEIVPLKYDGDIRFISDDKVIVKDGHIEAGEWVEGSWKIFDINEKKIIFTTEDSLRYSEYKYDYITIYSKEGYYYVYDFINKEYLFKDDKFDDIYILGRNTFDKRKYENNENLKETPLIEKIFPSENPEELEQVIAKYIGKDLLSTTIIYELLERDENDKVFVDWIKKKNQEISFEEALNFILNYMIDIKQFTYNETDLNKKLYNLIKSKDPKGYLSNIQIAYLMDITKRNNHEEESYKYILNIDEKKQADDMRWLLIFLINNDDE